MPPDEPPVPEESPSAFPQPTRRQFVAATGATVLATLLRPITSFAALDEMLAADTTSLDSAFWNRQPRASFVVIGDFGAGFNAPSGELTNHININAKAVADGIQRVLPYHADGPLVCVGDTIYVPFTGGDSPGFPGSAETWLAENLTPYDQAIGVLYHHYIRFPKGSTSRFAKHGARRQRFLTVLGDHDWWHQPRVAVTNVTRWEMDESTYPAPVETKDLPLFLLPEDAPYMEYFRNQDHGSSSKNVRYWDRADGNIHWFALSSDSNEAMLGTLANAYYKGPFPAGYSPGRENLLHSEQGQWFRKAVRRSKSHWKFVITHYPPYTSSAPGLGGHNPAIYMRWGYENYGVDAVFSGHVHAYERLYVNGVTYVVTGGGGTFESFAKFGASAQGSQRRVIDRYGFVAATEDQGKIFFRYTSVSTPGESAPPDVQDSFVLVRGGTLDTAAEIESQKGIHITGGGGTIETNGFSTSIAGALLGKGRLTKTGGGTLSLTKANPDFTGLVQLHQGEIALLAGQAIGEEAGWLLENGTLTAQGTQVSTRVLRVEGDARIAFGTGARMSFAESDAQAWKGSLTLEGAEARSLRIGTNAGGLTATQLGRISFSGRPDAKARMDSRGYVVAG